MATVIAVLLLCALGAPLATRVVRGYAGWLCAAVAIACLGYFLAALPLPPEGARAAHDWLPALGGEIAFRLDGLSLLFAVLITGIGALIFVYSEGYMAGKPGKGRFLGYLFFFMAAMLGVVLSDNLAAVYVFWELTSVASFLLIGFEHHDEEARKAARKALLVTSAGGLALLLGFVMLMRMAADLGLSGADTARISTLAELPLREHGLYVPALVLILLGAFTKSAQAPFHFWLPDAMTAPTPVSAYLHSATMVKAGVYLLARFHPMLGETLLWQVTVTSVGAVTMVTGAYLASRAHDIKRVLAYSTVSVLGILTMLLGVGTETAIKAAVAYLAAHALYKAALFMAAGNIDHATGTRDITRLGGLARLMPVTFAAALLAALSKAGAPPLFGFIGKELLYEGPLHLGQIGALLLVAAVAASVLLVAVALLVGVMPFLGPRTDTPEAPHEAPVSMLLGPVVLAALGLLLGIAPAAFDTPLGASAASAIAGRHVDMDLALWHGVDPESLTVMGLSALTLVVGFLVYRRLARHCRGAEEQEHEPRAGLAARAFERIADGLPRWAGSGVRLVYSGHLHHELYLVAAVALVAAGVPLTMMLLGGVPAPPALGVTVHEIVIALLIVAGAVYTTQTRSRLGAALALGVAGLCIALVFVLYSAPDLAITQIMVETLLVVLLVLLLRRLPSFARRSSRARLARDIGLSVLVGALMTGLTLASTAVHLPADAAAYFSRASVPEAHGHNVVNVVLVDFRALDTLGELLVVAVAGVGVCALLRQGLRRRGEGGRLAITSSLILRVSTRPMAALLGALSIVVLLRGHNAPGGGFIGGLLVTGAFALHAVTAGATRTRARLRVDPRTLVALGLVFVAAGALLPLLAGDMLLTSQWWGTVPGIGHVGTALVLDTGVYLIVWGTMLSILLPLAEEEP